ncbi:MAG: FHA domain-containing protein [Planctomycetota bacterium]
MNPLQIHITAGAQAGARLQLNQSPVTFGRSAECTLILDLPVASRLHGELQYDEEDAQWVLVNHSANGTRVGRKKATKKPVALTDGASITIGDTEVFRVHLTPAAAQEPQGRAFEDHPEQPDSPAPGAGKKDRSKLWIGLGVWFALCIGAMIFFATLGGDDDNDKGSNNAAAGFYYPGREFDDMVGDEAGVLSIRRLLYEHPTYQDPNASRYSSFLDRANQSADQGETGLYDAYKNYQMAIAFSNNRDQPFENKNDVLRYNRILDELSQAIYVRYMFAYRSYHNNDYQSARDTLDRLRMEFYANEDPEDPLANHIRKLRNAAHKRVR